MAKLTPPPKTAEASESDPNKSDIEEIIQQAKPKAPTEQTPPDEIAPLQLKIPTYRRNEFKAYAAMRGRSMNSLFLEMFDHYKKNNI